MAQVETEKLMLFLAKNIDAGFNGPPGPGQVKQTGFFLAIMPFGADFSLLPKPKVAYVSNLTDERIAEMLKDTFEGFGYHCFMKGTPT